MTSPDTPSSGTLAVGANGKHNYSSEKDDNDDDDIAPPQISQSPTQMTEETVVDDEGHVHQDGKQRADTIEQEGSESEVDDVEEDEEDDEEDDEEPSLKYQRIGGAVPDLLRKDSASALAVSNKLLVHFNST